MTIKELAEHYGTHDLLTAYIMRTANVSEEVAQDILYEVDAETEGLIYDLISDDEEE